MADAGMGAFSVFFIQFASFLEYQREMKLAKGRCNAESLFESKSIPSDNQIRNLLDGVSPASLSPAFQRIFLSLERQGCWKGTARMPGTTGTAEVKPLLFLV